MSWTNGQTRTSTAEWKRLRLWAQTNLDHQCQHAPRGQCAGGLELDHIIDVAQGGSDGPGNLQWLCKRHHSMKTQKSAASARARRRAEAQHPDESHPGLV